MTSTTTTTSATSLMQGLPTSSGGGAGGFSSHTVKPFHRRQGKAGKGLKFANLLPTYFRRMLKPKQMDFEYSFWLMRQLLASPRTAYRQTTYHKQTKNRWSRDDPAFVVICSLFMAVSASAYCISFGASVGQSIKTILGAVAVDFILLGIGLSSACWYLANTYLRAQSQSHQVEQKVEWLYAFDVHCNSYFPVFLMLYVLQYFLSPLLLSRSFFSSLLANLLYGFALSYYWYMNFLGYSALPFLQATDMFLYPIGIIGLMTLLAVLFGFNPAIFTLSIYFG